jgi:hypothetical protein
LDLASRQSTYFVEPGVANYPALARGDKIVFVEKDMRALRVRTRSTGQEQRVSLPDSMTVLRAGMNPGGDSIAAVIQTPTVTRLGVSPLSTWSPRWLHDFESDETTRTLSWTTSGDLYFWLWPSGDDAPGIFRIASSGGRPLRVRALPADCSTPFVVVALTATRGTCYADDRRGDVWLLTVPGVTR